MRNFQNIASLRFSLIFPMVLSACQTVPGTERSQFIAVPRAQEKAMGEEAYKETLAKEKVSTDVRLNAVLQRVGKRISAVVPVSDFNWEFKLIESKEMNAWCMPGGKVAFYTGILPVLENEGGMAIVMGHEIAHAVARHGAERMSQGLAAQGLMTVLDVGVLHDSKYRGAAMAALGLGAQVGIMLPFSRKHESEADTLGIKYAAMAGYDPAEGPRFWQRFSKATSGGGKPPAFLSTHPADTDRIQNLEKLQVESMSLYEKTPKYGLGEKL